MTVINISNVVAGAAFETHEVHWGNVGSFIGGIATAILAAVAIVSGTAALKDWRARLREERALAEEQRKEIRLDRQRVLQGWSRHNVNTYSVALITDAAELRRAAEELSGREPSEYVVLRVTDGNTVNRARSLRNLIKAAGCLSRVPSTDEFEALEFGRQRLLSAAQAEVPSTA